MSRTPLLIFCVLTIRKQLPGNDFERSGRGQEPSRGHKFSILENFLSIRDFTSSMRLHFRSDLVGVALVGAKPLHLLSQTVLPLKSPTGAFIAALRKRELAYGRQSRLITPPAKRNRAFPTGNALLYISLSSVVFNRKFYKQRNSQRPVCDMQFTVVANESNRELLWQGASYSGAHPVFVLRKNLRNKSYAFVRIRHSYGRRASFLSG